jgi:outer membrane protein assembly factor BamB
LKVVKGFLFFWKEVLNIITTVFLFMVYLYCDFIKKLFSGMIDKYIKLIAAGILISVFYSYSQTPSGFRGADRSGIYKESGLLKVWPASGPSLLWETSGIGTGYSSVTVTEDAIFITGRKGDNDVLTAFTQDGKKKWEVAYGKSSDSNYPDTRGTPTFLNGRLFLVSGMGDMVCISNDGKKIWSVNYFPEYEGVTPDFGISECPLVVGNKVIGTPGGKKAAMVAFNVENGNVIWETASINDVTQYVNPLLVEYGGKKMVVTQSAEYVFAVDSNTGKLLWKFNYAAENTGPEQRFAHINTPIFSAGYLFVASGYDKVALKFKLKPDGSVPSVVWRNNDLDPCLGGAILLGDYLYGSNWETSSFGKWVCVDWKTGKTVWITDWYNKGSIIAADGMLYIFEEKTGHVGLVKPGTEKLDVVSEFKIEKGKGPYWAHPVIDKGRLFIRHGDYLAVYSIK